MILERLHLSFLIKSFNQGNILYNQLHIEAQKNDTYFADDIFKLSFLYAYGCILIQD